MNINALQAQLIEHEGLRLDLYKDSVGIWTIGVGRNLEHVGLRSEVEAKYLLRSDILAIRSELLVSLPWITDLDDVRQRVLTNMAFNLGVTGLLGFHKTLGFISDGKYVDAAQEMLRSRWARQVGKRAIALSEMMARGG